MSEKEDQGDVGDETANSEYEDDFEKDPEDLTDEKDKQSLGEEENPKEEEEVVEAQNPKDHEEMEENPDQLSEADENVKVLYSNEKYMESGLADTEQKDHESEKESSIQESKLENEQELGDREDEELKRSVLGKTEEANKDLENQVPLDESRERKLKFKDEMGLQAPSPEDAEAGKTDLAIRGDVSVVLSQLHISDYKGQKPTSLSERAGPDGKILVEKDRKFELLSLCDIESQGVLPPISVSFTDIEIQQTSPFPIASQVIEKPPSDSKNHPDSALDGAKYLGKQKTESAGKSLKGSTYSLTPRQKELRKLIELRKERLKIEEEERKMELEEIRRRENEKVFRAWLQKKKEQMKREKQNRRAKQLEELRKKEVNRDPEEAYRSWLKKKRQQYVKEKRIELLRRQTEEVSVFPSAEECDRAFKDWLRRKREEKQAAELAAKERVRQIRLEARRARNMRNIHHV